MKLWHQMKKKVYNFFISCTHNAIWVSLNYNRVNLMWPLKIKLLSGG